MREFPLRAVNMHELPATTPSNANTMFSIFFHLGNEVRPTDHSKSIMRRKSSGRTRAFANISVEGALFNGLLTAVRKYEFIGLLNESLSGLSISSVVHSRAMSETIDQLK